MWRGRGEAMKHTLILRIKDRPIRSSLLLVVFVALVGGAALIGRSIASVVFGSGCRSNLDCFIGGQVCRGPNAFACGTCYDDSNLSECDSNNSCPTGQICKKIRSGCSCYGYGKCVESCATAGCSPGQRCREDGACEPLRCNTDSECGGAYCVNGQCSQSLGYCDSAEPRP